MRWILPVVLLAACAGVSALPISDPPATDDLSGLIGQPAPGWKLEADPALTAGRPRPTT